jgi:hypothetical protein
MTDEAPHPESSVPPRPEPPSDVEAPPELAAALAEVDALRARLERERKKRRKSEKKKGEGGQLGSNRGVETMFRTSYRTHVDLSHLADNKANIMISINGIIISILLASISPKIDANPWLLLPTSVLLVGCVVSMVYAVLAARPRVSRQRVTLDDVRADRANILFFGNFVQLAPEEYEEGMRELMLNTDQLYLNMVRDIYALGRVLARKFRLLKVSYTTFMIALVLGVGLYLVVFGAVVSAGGGGAIVLP